MSLALLTILVSSAAMIEPPQPINPASWLSFKDHPDPGSHKSGFVEVILSVSPIGKAVRCEVTVSSGVPQFDQYACDLYMVRSSFIPAQDQNGQAVAGTYFSGFLWSSSPSSKPHRRKPDIVLKVSTLPKLGKQPTAQFWLLMSAGPKPEICALSRREKQRDLENIGCPALMSMTDLPPVLDADGHPVRGVRSFSIGFERKTDRPLGR